MLNDVTRAQPILGLSDVTEQPRNTSIVENKDTPDWIPAKLIDDTVHNKWSVRLCPLSDLDLDHPERDNFISNQIMSDGMETDSPTKDQPIVQIQVLGIVTDGTDLLANNHDQSQLFTESPDLPMNNEVSAPNRTLDDTPIASESQEKSVNKPIFSDVTSNLRTASSKERKTITTEGHAKLSDVTLIVCESSSPSEEYQSRLRHAPMPHRLNATSRRCRSVSPVNYNCDNRDLTDQMDNKKKTTQSKM